ncbi:hypothetical protein ACFLUJ_08650 [Chloroflexota bacterium]
MRKVQIMVGSLLIVVLFILGACATAEEEVVVTEEEVVTEEGVVITEEGTIPAAELAKLPKGYEYDAYYPIILSISDDKGNIAKGSMWNFYVGLPEEGSQYIVVETGTILELGETITLTVDVYDYQDREVFYMWDSTATPIRNNIMYDEDGKIKWSTSNQVTYTIGEEDIAWRYKDVLIYCNVRVEDKDLYREPTKSRDDSIVIGYILGE